MCASQLEKMKSTPVRDARETTFTGMLKEDLQHATFKGHHKVTDNAAHIDNVKNSFLTAMIDNLKKRLAIIRKLTPLYIITIIFILYNYINI